MYRQLLTKKKTLICVDEVIQNTSVDQEVDPRQINAAIQIAEERFIRSALCNNLYNDFRDKKNVEVTLVNEAYLESLMPDVDLQVGDIVNAIEFVSNDYYVALWYEHLCKLCAEAVIYIATPTNAIRFTAQGEMQNNPKVITGEGQGSASIEVKDVWGKMQKLMEDRIAPLIAGMDQWLYSNRSYYPFADCKDWYGYSNFDYTNGGYANGGTLTPRKTGWITGLYDRLDRPDKCYQCTDRY